MNFNYKIFFLLRWRHHNRQRRFGLGKHFRTASERIRDKFAPPTTKFDTIPEDSSGDEHEAMIKSTAPNYSPMSDIAEEEMVSLMRF